MSDTNFSNREETLKCAMQMEKDGIEYYAEAATNSSQALGRNLFLSLVEDEKKHYEWLEQLLESVEGACADAPAVRGKERFETIFSEARKESGGVVKGTNSDLEAIDRACEMEKKGFEYYKKAAAESSNTALKELCEKLADWESNHFEMLQNTKKYLQDPKEWFTWEEGALLDGGGAFA